MPRQFDIAAVFENRAAVSGEVILHEGEDSEPVFAFETAQGQRFSMDLGTMLACIMIAEDEHYLPKIGMGWWQQVSGRYPSAFQQQREGKLVHEGIQATGEQ